MSFSLRLKVSDFLIAFGVSATIAWCAWPKPFVEPPVDAALESSEGLLVFRPGKSEPSMLIGGDVFLCSYSKNWGPSSACLLDRRDSPPTRVVAKWYWHPSSTGGRVRLLVSVVSTSGELLLPPAVQRGRLLKAGQDAGMGIPLILCAAGAVFLALLAMFRRDSGKGQGSAHN
jgi:hypothetical protein